MKEEDNILRKAGTENAFRVPDGYFEHLTSEVMNRLPEKEKTDFVQKEPSLWDKVKPWLYMTAMFVGAALIIRVASDGKDPSSAESLAVEEDDMELEYIDAMMGNAMMDDYSLYVYLTDTAEE